MGTVKKILFVCKYNRFRSQFAAAYFNSINKNKNIEVSSAGIIEFNAPFLQNEVERNKYILDNFGITLVEDSRGINARLLQAQDKIVVVASDIPRIIFNYPDWEDKVVYWKIDDVPDNSNEDKVNESLEAIKLKVNDLIKELGGLK